MRSTTDRPSSPEARWAAAAERAARVAPLVLTVGQRTGLLLLLTGGATLGIGMALVAVAVPSSVGSTWADVVAICACLAGLVVSGVGLWLALSWGGLSAGVVSRALRPLNRAESRGVMADVRTSRRPLEPVKAAVTTGFAREQHRLAVSQCFLGAGGVPIVASGLLLGSDGLRTLGLLGASALLLWSSVDAWVRLRRAERFLAADAASRS